MAPIKFEEHIKDKLDKREIHPSDRAWAEISSQLDPGKGGIKKGYYRTGIAASIIGLLIISIIYINTNDELVETDVKTVATPESVFKDLPNENSGEVHQVDDTTNPTFHIVGTENHGTPNKLSEDTVRVANRKEVEIENIIDSKEYMEPDLVEGKLLGPDSLINAKIEEVLAQVNLLEQNNTPLTDAEVDSLLKRAQKELFLEKAFRNNHSVDAMALLADVEGELDQTFREQILEMLKEGYLKVKTAVASRNN